MKRAGVLLALLALMTMSASVFADGSKMTQMDKGEKAEAAMTVKGEVVDMGCYLGHGARGADHKSCAEKCIAGGMPMGLLTSDGTLYLLTMSHEDADPFDKAKGLAAETVSITGPVSERNGVKSIEVDQISQEMAVQPGKTN